MLTPKQVQFVAEYLIDLNATQAAIRAGYSAKTANRIASENLSKPDIQAAIQDAMQRREERTEVTQDRVLRELAKIGFADIRKAVQWGASMPVVDEETGDVTLANGISLVPSDKLDADTAAAISEVAQTRDGLRVKFHDKRAALVDMGRHLGMFLDRTEATVKAGRALEDMTDEELAAEAAKYGLTL